MKNNKSVFGAKNKRLLREQGGDVTNLQHRRRLRGRERVIMKYSQTQTQTHTDRQTYRHWQTDRQADRQTGRQADTDKPTSILIGFINVGLWLVHPLMITTTYTTSYKCPHNMMWHLWNQTIFFHSLSTEDIWLNDAWWISPSLAIVLNTMSVAIIEWTTLWMGLEWHDIE